MGSSTVDRRFVRRTHWLRHACFSSPETGVASVQAVYVEVASDIYVSERRLAASTAQDYWVKLTLADDHGQDITT